ncbi:hypothetical protein [Hymenobacter swuensis]|uniref:hypothetical protein n=1 Tax=Hymenobacter swuensis TaxID=1446467 RepID=UPI0012DF829E|nr:hypothetical protein [Hymenobacter swuensis]
MHVRHPVVRVRGVGNGFAERWHRSRAGHTQGPPGAVGHGEVVVDELAQQHGHQACGIGEQQGRELFNQRIEAEKRDGVVGRARQRLHDHGVRGGITSRLRQGGKCLRPRFAVRMGHLVE